MKTLTNLNYNMEFPLLSDLIKRIDSQYSYKTATLSSEDKGCMIVLTATTATEQDTYIIVKSVNNHFKLNSVISNKEVN